MTSELYSTAPNIIANFSVNIYDTLKIFQSLGVNFLKIKLFFLPFTFIYSSILGGTVGSGLMCQLLNSELDDQQIAPPT